jgi:hypothetical protein
LGGLLSPVLGIGGGQNSSPGLVQPGAFYLLLGDDSEDALQSLAYLAPIINGGYWQHVQACGHRGYVLAGHGEGGSCYFSGSFSMARLASNDDLLWSTSASLASVAALSPASLP